MSLTWRQTWSRLSKMSWNEVQTRAGQEVSKRFDLAMYRAGLQPARNGLSASKVSPGKFFFSAEDLPARVRLLKATLGSEAEAIICEADEICAHRFCLLGYSNLDYGAEIDWHLDAVHRKRAPLKPWFKINFLDFEQVGDHKVTWELNRHQHLVTLAKAFRLTQEDRYVVELIKQWDGWQKANPYPLGINWGSSLEVAFRSLSWLWVSQLLAGCPAVEAGFEARLLSALALHGRHIEKYLSTYFSPNTHLLGEAVALFFLGTLCPQLPAAERWQNDGWRIVLQEADRQVCADGVYFEQSLYYHVYALDFFLHARLLAERNGRKIPATFDQILQKMLNVVDKVSQPEPPEGFGDDDGGRVFNPRRNRAEHLRDPLALGAAIFPASCVAPPRLTEELIWLCGGQANPHSTLSPSDSTELEPKAFEAGGIYVMASSRGFPQRMVIDAGPHGTGRGGHAHADALSATVSLEGRPWLVDPGTFCYISPGNERDWFRGTGAHNTLRVDGLDQAVPDGPFAWKSRPEVSAEWWQSGISYTLFAGSHTGYCRLADPVVHRRFVFHLYGEFWLVRDVVDGKQSHELEISWHFAEGLAVSTINDGVLAEQGGETGAHPGNCRGLFLLTARREPWSCELTQEQVSSAYGLALEAPVLRCKARLQLPTEQATLIVPAANKSEARTFTRIEPAGISLTWSGYRCEASGKRHYMIFAGKQEPSWKVGPWESDARFFYCAAVDRRVTHLIVTGASYLKLRDREVFAQERKMDRLEWMDRDGGPQLYPGIWPGCA